MFDGLDMNALLAQAQQMQSEMMKAQEEVAAKQFVGTAGGDLVQAVVSGTGDLLNLGIKAEAWDPEDTETLSALIIAAFRAAKEQADAAARASLPHMPPGLGFQG